MGYLRAIIQEIGGIESLTPLDKEFVFHALTLINRLEEILGADGQDNNPDSIASALKGFLRLFKQLARNQRIPFTGEPLAGLQVMGVLETRNLDFKNVMILSMNEGSLPASGRKSSYIPHNIRLAYGLPTAQHQDSIYAYLFYRVLQRAENVFLFYNTEPDVLGQGEMSRFLQQIIHESGWDIEHKILHNPVSPHKVLPIEIKKTEKVLQSMARLNEGTRTFKGISPSALNTYLECQLQFYLKHIARIYEPKEVEEYLDVRVVGILLHEVMEKFYQGIQEKKKSSLIQATDFIHAEAVVDKLIEEVFRKKYSIDNKSKMTFEGQGLVVKEIIRSFASRIIALDKEYAPFTIEGLERAEWLYYVKIAHAPGQAVLSGKIDRLDRKGDVVRVLDYKTGKKDSSEFKDIESLFDRNGKRNKAAFQTMIYAMLYKANNPTTGVKLRPGLITRATLFDDQGSGLILDKIPVDDAHTIMGQFEEKLQLLLEELYNPEETFKQTQNTEICRYCNFKNICYR